MMPTVVIEHTCCCCCCCWIRPSWCWFEHQCNKNGQTYRSNQWPDDASFKTWTPGGRFLVVIVSLCGRKIHQKEIFFVPWLPAFFVLFYEDSLCIQRGRTVCMCHPLWWSIGDVRNSHESINYSSNEKTEWHSCNNIIKNACSSLIFNHQSLFVVKTRHISRFFYLFSSFYPIGKGQNKSLIIIIRNPSNF